MIINNLDELNNIDISASGVSFFLTIAFIYGIVFSIVFYGLYFLKAIGIYKMSVSAGIKNPWLAFVPFANSFAFGKLAEKYKKRDGTQSAKFSIILLVLEIATFILTIVLIIFTISSCIQIIVNADTALQNNSDMTISMFSSLIPVIVFSFIISIVGIVYSVINYIALWRIFSSFDYQNATLYTVLAIFFNFLEPIFIFVLRKHSPTFEYSQRMGVYTNNY